MGSHSSKAARGDVLAQDAAPALDAAGSPSKANGQENGHVKINGDLSSKADGEAAPLNGNGSAEQVKEEPKVEVGGGDAIEPAPVAEGGESNPEGTAAAAPKETPKKKNKRFSFKKSFKLSGLSFRKAKKELGDAPAAASPSEDQGHEEAKAEEGSAPGESEQVSVVKEEPQEEEEEEKVAAAAPVDVAAQEGMAEREEGSLPPTQPEEEKLQLPQQPPQETPQEDTKPEEGSKPAEVEPSSAPEQAQE